MCATNSDKLIKTSIMVENLAKAQETLTQELKETNKKLDTLTELLAKQEVLSKEITFLNDRVNSLEKARIWISTTILGAVILAVFKLIFK